MEHTGADLWEALRAAYPFGEILLRAALCGFKHCWITPVCCRPSNSPILTIRMSLPTERLQAVCGCWRSDSRNRSDLAAVPATSAELNRIRKRTRSTDTP